MNKENKGVFGESHSTATVKEMLANYFTNWPLFLASILICVSAGVLYTRYTVPKYLATTSFLIKGGDGGKPSSDDLIESALSGKKEVNLNNEIMLINAASLMEQTVARKEFNISYLKKGRILDIDIYKDAPFRLIPTLITDSNRNYKFFVKQLNITGGKFSSGAEKAEKLFSFRWNEPFKMENQQFTLLPNGKIENNDGEYIVIWEPVATAAAKLSEGLTVKPYDTKTSVLQVSAKTENLQKGKDLLNALFNEFNRADIVDRNKLSASTVEFIDDRLVAISSELKGVEGSLENYQGSNQLVDIRGQSTLSLENSSAVSKTIKDLAVQQSVTGMITEYFANPANENKLVPSSLGLNDATLSTLITQYNDLQLKKEREAPMVAPNSTVMQDMNSQLGSLKGSILESLNNISKNLRLQDNSFRQQNNQYKGFLSAVPHNERVLQEIKRKQSITEGLYLYLLQKREEAAISSTSANVANYKQIDLATGYGPVEPKKLSIIVYAGLLGFFLAFGYIYLKRSLNDNITSKMDITSRTTLPFLGEISHVSKKNKQIISVLDRNVIGEQFRVIRTNLSFLLKNKNSKVILVTSSGTGEGKSFFSLNFAAVCAIPGKKVALLEFDTRLPVLGTNLNLYNEHGLTDYLTGRITDISTVRNEIDNIPGLHVFLAGPVLMNAADLLLTENMNRLFEDLKKLYDYVIVDSPPAGIVSDPFILGAYSDMVMYVLRCQKTSLKQIDFISDIADNKTFQQVALILNDVKQRDNYSYTYGKGHDYTNLNGAKQKNKPFGSALK